MTGMRKVIADRTVSYTHLPIPNFAKRLIENGIITEAEAKEIDAQAKKDIEDATKFAKDAPYPEPEDLFEDLYA